MPRPKVTARLASGPRILGTTVKREADDDEYQGFSRKRPRIEAAPTIFHAVREWPITGVGLLAQSNLKDVKLLHDLSFQSCLQLEATDIDSEVRYAAQLSDIDNRPLANLVRAVRHQDLNDHLDFSVQGSLRGEDAHLVASVEIDIKESFISARLSKRALTARADLINALFPLVEDNPRLGSRSLSVRDFYQALSRPPARPEGDISHIEAMPECTLLPFQSASVTWLLSKEGVHLDSNLQIQPLSNDQVPSNPLWQSVSSNGEGQAGHLWVDSLSGDVSLDEPGAIRGRGMLLEEMGLGKTVEIIALISLHRQPNRHLLPTFRDPRLDIDIQPSSLTLILCPPTILSQWVGEISKHAPSIRTYVYTGVAKLEKSKTSSDEEVEEWHKDYDVILCSFDILAKDVYYSRPSAGRQLRTGKKELRRSPLCQIEWFRICLDEVQMMGSSASQCGEVASTLHRKNSFVLSGTPLQKSIEDLRPLLGFLQLWPANIEKKMCQQLLLSSKLPALEKLLSQLCIRTTKESVASELSVPKQRFHLVQVTQDPIERVRYSGQYSETLADLTRVEYDMHGNRRPVSRQRLLHWLTVLRQTCSLPPLVADTTGPKQIQTLEETLHQMVRDNKSAQHSEARAKVATMVKRAHLISRDREDCEGLERSVKIFDLAIVEIKALLATTAKSAVTNTIETSSGSATPTEKSSRYEYSLLLHSALFYKGNALFTLGSSYGDQEIASYQEAESVRNQMLADQKAAFDQSVGRNQASRQDMDRHLKQLQNARKCVNACKDSEELMAGIDQLDRLSEVAIEWRQELLKMLCRSVKDDDIAEDEADAYYSTQAANQEKIDLYLDFYKQVLADLRELLTGRRNILADEFSSAVGISIRQQQGKVKFDKLIDNGAKKSLVIDPNDPGAALFFDLLSSRIAARGSSTINVKRLLQELSFGGLRSSDVAIVEKALRHAGEGCTAMDNELSRDFESMATTRFQYFARLQAVSDSVGDFDLSASKTKTFLGEIRRCEEEEAANAKKAAELRSQGIYLASLAAQNSESAVCTICDDAIKKEGILTACGHVFCRKCLTTWFRTSKTCPLCKSQIPNDSYFKVRTSGELHIEQERQLKLTSTTTSVQAAPKPASDLVYISAEQLATIQAIEHGAEAVGAKVDSIVKHIVYLRAVKGDAKILLFSAWSAGLEVCMAALRESGIGYVRLDKGKRKEAVTKFNEDPDAAVFILNASSSAAGLNLIAAKTVIFFEPLLNSSIEQQAVGRVHRIGQTEVTDVFQYVIADSVESRIVQAQAASGQSLFVRGREQAAVATEAPSTLKADDIGAGTGSEEVASLLLDPGDLGKLYF